MHLFSKICAIWVKMASFGQSIEIFFVFFFFYERIRAGPVWCRLTCNALVPEINDDYSKNQSRAFQECGITDTSERERVCVCVCVCVCVPKALLLGYFTNRNWRSLCSPDCLSGSSLQGVALCTLCLSACWWSRSSWRAHAMVPQGRGQALRSVVHAHAQTLHTRISAVQ